MAMQIGAAGSVAARVDARRPPPGTIQRPCRRCGRQGSVHGHRTRSRRESCVVQITCGVGDAPRDASLRVLTGRCTR
eukprot:scaffold2357_cov399-Prasinococcus_capsulatus_cf.AAC.10